MIFFGIKASNFGAFPFNGTTCQHCQNSIIQNLIFFSKYAPTLLAYYEAKFDWELTL